METLQGIGGMCRGLDEEEEEEEESSDFYRKISEGVYKPERLNFGSNSGCLPLLHFKCLTRLYTVASSAVVSCSLYMNFRLLGTE